jgi:HEAT repeat protein
MTPANRLAERDLETLWAALGGEDGIKAHDAIWALAEAHAQSVPLFKARLRQVPPTAVRLIARHIQDLDNDDFAVRERASAALGQVLEAAAPALRKTLEGQPSPEVRTRIEQLLARHEGNLFSEDHLRTARAIEVLEHIGTAEARAVLVELAKGAPGVWQTEDAKEALGRLACRRGALP